ncbi:MAG: TapB family protein, partial [Candidatus Binataceae bacterium]
KQSHRTFAEIRQIETPAGHFNNCIRIETEATYQGGMYARKKQHLTYLDWYAPNVGLIKTVTLEGGPTGPEMDRVELLRFNVIPPSAQNGSH